MGTETLHAWRLAPLPDFLADHTLAGETAQDRLREHAARWVQWVGSLWEWRDRATFALRYLAREGRIDISLIASAHHASESGRLRAEIEVLMRAHRLMPDPAGGRIAPDRLEEESVLPKAAILEVTQYSTRSLWRLPAHFQRNETFRTRYAWLPPSEWEQPLVIYPWWGPGGPFLIPMESLLSLPVPASLSIYLQPTELRAHEWEWLALMASEAQSKGEQSIQQIGSGAALRTVDPSAALAGRLYMANLRRLSATPFLVTAHCAAADGRVEAARSLAGALQALVHEPPFERPQQEEQRLPAGASLGAENADRAAHLARQYRDLHFPAPTAREPLARLQHLADAAGAATVFRLPVSVRGGVPGLRVRQLPPDFHPGARESKRPPDHVQLGHYHAGGGAFVPVRDFTKHTLVTGFTGSGKTVTVLQLLHQLWVDHDVPFLVLESAKQEYRGLVTVEAIQRKQPGLRVYTLGNELGVPFRLNPFELLPGVRVEAHLSKLQSCIEGAIPPIGPSSSIISEALLRAYEQCGWMLTDSYPLQGTLRRPFPVLSDFVRAVEQVLHERAYAGEVKSNLQAALVGRFRPLLLGGKGRLFDTQRSSPAPAELFGGPVILEMNDLSLDDKALVVMFLLTLLREHRELHRSQHGELLHVTVVEEAHNVLEDVGSVGGGEGATAADTRHKAVQAFCSLLTEIRALGEGLIIADQSPEKLARDALRNTNLQIAHQLRDGHDRDAVANAMIMEPEQRDFLGKLPPGQAALFRTGLEKATFVQVEKYYPTRDDLQRAPSPANPAAFELWKKAFRGYGFNPLLPDADLVRVMQKLDPALASRRKLILPYPECSFCGSPCLHRDLMFVETGTDAARRRGLDWFKLTDIAFRTRAGLTLDQLWLKAADGALDTMKRVGLTPSPDAAWCHFIHVWDRAMRANRQNRQHPGGQLDRTEREALLRRFSARIAAPPAQARLLVRLGAGPVRSHILGAEALTIGSAADATVRLAPAPGVPPVVAALRWEQGSVLLENRRSGRRQILQDGTRLNIEGTPLEIQVQIGAACNHPASMS